MECGDQPQSAGQRWISRRDDDVEGRLGLEVECGAGLEEQAGLDHLEAGGISSGELDDVAAEGVIADEDVGNFDLVGGACVFRERTYFEARAIEDDLEDGVERKGDGCGGLVAVADVDGEGLGEAEGPVAGGDGEGVDVFGLEVGAGTGEEELVAVADLEASGIAALEAEDVVVAAGIGVGDAQVPNLDGGDRVLGDGVGREGDGGGRLVDVGDGQGESRRNGRAAGQGGIADGDGEGVGRFGLEVQGGSGLEEEAGADHIEAGGISTGELDEVAAEGVILDENVGQLEAAGGAGVLGNGIEGVAEADGSGRRIEGQSGCQRHRRLAITERQSQGEGSKLRFGDADGGGGVDRGA